VEEWKSGNQEKEWSALPFGILTAKPYLTAACFESKDNGKQAQGLLRYAIMMGRCEDLLWVRNYII